MPGEILERLHGAIRTPRSPQADRGADTVDVAGVEIGKGDKVRLVPRVDADAQDMFLDGRIATVEAVLCDVDGGHHLAVTLDDDPGSDIKRLQGRFFYFRPDEVRPA
jgi:hypothetical protein